MKVAYYIGSLNRGGAEMLLLDICRKKECAPYEILLVYRNEGELSGCFRSTGVPMFRLKPKGLKLSYFNQLRRLLKHENVEILHAQTLTNAVIGVFVTLFTKIRLVATFHGFYQSKLNALYRHVVMWNADAMVFVSKDLCEWYTEHSLLCPRHRCHVVYNGINFDKLDTDYPVPDFLTKTNDDKGETIRLAMVGNFTGVRSQIVVCRGFKLLKKEGINNIDLYFVGKKVETEPHYYDECIKYCMDNEINDMVHFVGSRGDVPAILQHIDGFVYSSIRDSFGIAVVEALASGAPVIVNDWKVMVEIIQNKEWASFFHSNDEKDCCEKIIQLVENIELRKQQAQIHMLEVRNTYSIEKHIMNLNKVYEDVV